MRYRPARVWGRCNFCVFAGLAICCILNTTVPRALASEQRRTAIVEAVERARNSIVNIHGEKTIEAHDARTTEGKRRVNGMGTGVIIDERGYVITNHHVVDGVRKIMVTTSARETLVARLISHDPKTDLAIIKIDADHEFEVIDIGTSSDLMAGETVIAVGNAFGYEHTVTRGIISALHRMVQVSDAQNYEDLIQTDASINPGNSGGPLLNIDGKMIGVNVAVRAGAQGIGFAIPADKVMQVAADLLSTRRLSKAWHGVQLRPVGDVDHPSVVVESIEQESPAKAGGLKLGDVIMTVGDKRVLRPLDLERALLGRQPGDSIEVGVERNHKALSMSIVLAATDAGEVETAEPIWDVLGLRLAPISQKQFQQYRTRYHGGLSVLEVRADSPAAQQGIRRGDVLVGMHIWETVTMENVSYILNRPDFAQLDPLKFYILRGNETLFGHFTVSHP
jgi:serine protease Do